MEDEKMTDDSTLSDWVHAAAAGDRAAAEHLVAAIQDDVYRLALRMLGHPSDAEDATQEALLIVITHLGSFRGESAVRTWVWRIAANHLLRAKKGRRETLSFESLGERLDHGLSDRVLEVPEAESSLYAQEIRLRCTEGMLLCLDRDSRLAYILGDIFGLSGEEAASVLEIAPSAYRKRLSRARGRLFAFMRARCGIYDPGNPCRCEGQVAAASERGLLREEELVLIRHPMRKEPAQVERCAIEVGELFRVAEVVRDHPDYAAPQALIDGIRKLLDSGRFELLSN
jgi:RNA polymerase sigma factor (sigma-70 family)